MQDARPCQDRGVQQGRAEQRPASEQGVRCADYGVKGDVFSDVGLFFQNRKSFRFARRPCRLRSFQVSSAASSKGAGSSGLRFEFGVCGLRCAICG